ncbi:mechanosensitive ion channel family protein [Gemmatimonas sp.]|uniref:mechanosensitive ion channel family protein n=1 Tax=Gemmatimonas sp. TaxID=1962908 RepID=UPI0027B914D0|nr:mechanosensitive ion channel family protein [Gemmatimonas sp.]
MVCLHVCRRASVAAVVLSVAGALPLSAQLGIGARPPQDTAPTTVSPASPRAAVQEFLRQANTGDWNKAAEFLSVPAAKRERAPLLARRFKTVIDQRLALDLSTLSPLVSGDTLDDDLTGDRLAELSGPGGRSEPLRLVRLAGPPVHWVFSQATVNQIDGWYEALGSPWVRERVPRTLLGEGPFNVYWWQWIGLGIGLPVLVLLAWVLGAVLRSMLGRLAKRTVTNWDDVLLENLRGPFRLWAAALAATPLFGVLALNPRVSGFLDDSARGLTLLALFWVLLRLIRIAQNRLQHAAWDTGQGAQARTLVPLLGNFLRVALAIIALLVALAQFGYPVGTLLAGLGIGGIAVALAAQKTVEHLFGSVSLAADRAFRVGDWVRAGTTEGEVQRIGLRSTSFRTIDRTVVRVPNGRLADERIETFGERDRILLRTDIDLTYDTTPEQITAIRDALDAALRAHPKIWPDTVRVHVVAFTDSAIRLNVVSWFQTTEWNEFLRIRHDMLMQFMRIIGDKGAAFAYPSRTVYHVTQSGQPAPPIDG